MFKISSSLGIAAFLVLCIATSSLAISISYTVTFDQNDFYFRQDKGYDIIGHPDCVAYGEIGAPQVLSFSCNFIIPENEGIAGVKIDTVVEDNFPNIYNLLPVQYPEYYSNCCDTAIQLVEPDPLYYENFQRYPVDIEGQATEGYFDGANHIATVILHPVYYKPTEQKLYYYSSITFTLSTSGYPTKSPIFVQSRLREDQKSFDEALYNIVENPNDIISYGYIPSLSDSAVIDNENASPIPSYLIITRDSLMTYWDPFVDWLNRKGKLAKVVSIENIVAQNIPDDPEIYDDSNLLRGYLKYNYQQGVAWVLLGGVSDHALNPNINSDNINVPPRYVIDGAVDNDPNRTRRLTDLYFSEFNLDWEVDGDGVPGERYNGLQGDPSIVDFTHLEKEEDVFLGRLPVIDGQDIINWTQKILNYEQNPGNGGYNYLFQAYWESADQFQDWTYPPNNENQAHMNADEFPPGVFSHEYVEETPSTSNPLHPTGGEVITGISEMPGFINFHHHGNNMNGFVRTAPGIEDQVLTEENQICYYSNNCHIYEMTNIDRPGFLFSVSCLQAEFDKPYDLQLHCLGCSYCLDETGGTTFMGGSSELPIEFAWRAKNHFLNYIFDDLSQEPCAFQGKIGPAKVYMDMTYTDPNIGVWGMLEDWMLLGSPEQEIWSTWPSHFTVVPDYENNSVTVTSGANAVESALVCFSSRDFQRYFLATTDANGVAQVSANYDFDITEATNITVTKHNYIPYQIMGAGDIDNNIYWRGDIAFYGDIVVPADKILTIKPGARVYASGSELSVYGQLKIEGSADEPEWYVEMTSVNQAPTAGDWEGIKIYQPGSLEMDFCRINYASNGVEATTANLVDIQNSNFKDFDLSGVTCVYPGAGAIPPIISNCVFSGPGSHAIVAMSGNPTITYNEISGALNGITYLGNSNYQGIGSPIIQHNKLAGSNDYGIGIYVSRYSAQSLGPIPDLQYNLDSLYSYGIWLDHCPGAIMKGNRSAKNDVVGLCVSYGSPVIVGGDETSGEFNQFSDNYYMGISVCGNCSPFFGLNAIKRNSLYGVRIYSGCGPSFGEIDGFGLNSIDGGVYDGYNGTGYQISACGNYWNTNGTPSLYGTWDARDALIVDPFTNAKRGLPMAQIPTEFKLHGNYPNPFNPTTMISFDLPKAQTVRICIYNILGQKIKILADSYLEAGTHNLIWDGLDNAGIEVNSGVYFYSFTSEEFNDSKKMTLVR